MTTAVQRRRGTTTEHASFTGLEGEISVNTTKDTLVVHDGSTAGGFELARADGSNFVASTVDINGGTIDGTAIGASSASTGAFTTLTASGEITANGGIALGDNDKATFGADDDLQIYSDGTNAIIKEDTGGSLYIGGADVHLMNPAFTEYYISAEANGAVTLRHDNGLKLATTSTGIDVTGTATMDGLVVSNSGPNTDILLTEGNTNTDARIRNSNGILEIDADLNNEFGSSAIVFAVDGTDRLKVDRFGDISFYEDTGTTPKFFWDASAESLGIGTSSPDRPVHLGGSGNRNYIKAETTASTSGDEAGFEIKTATANWLLLSKGNAGDLIYYDAASAAERMRIDSSGNVGIGVGNSKEAMIQSTNSGRVASNPAYSFNGDLDTGMFNPQTDNTIAFATDGAERMRIDASGNLALGDSNAYTHRLFVKGVGTNEAVGLAVGTNGNNVIRFYNSGLGTAGAINVASGGTTVTYNTSSDQRLKENIADADDAGSKVDAIQVRKFDWIADGSHQDYGMIAQELQTVAPEAVSGDADSEEMMGVDYSKLVPMLIKEIQSLRNRVAQLEGI